LIQVKHNTIHKAQQFMQPEVSILMPNFNGEKFLAAAIESVRAQTFANWELLVIDDGSTDSSPAIMQSYAQIDPRIRCLRTTFPKVARGPAAARNSGIEVAKGRFIAFLDCDDLWLPSKLERQLGFMKEHGAAFTYTWYDVINEDGHVVDQRKPKPLTRTYRELLRDCVIGCLTAVYDTQALGKQFINLHPMDRFADYSLWLKILKSTPKAYCLQEVLAQYRLATTGISANKLLAAKHDWQLLRHVEGLSLFPALYYFSWYAVKGVLTKLHYILLRRERRYT